VDSDDQPLNKVARRALARPGQYHEHRAPEANGHRNADAEVTNREQRTLTLLRSQEDRLAYASIFVPSTHCRPDLVWR